MKMSNDVSGSCHLHSHCIMVMNVVSFPFTAQYFANSCFPYMHFFINVVAVYTTNSFMHVQNSTLLFAIKMFFNPKIYLTKLLNMKISKIEKMHLIVYVEYLMKAILNSLKLMHF